MACLKGVRSTLLARSPAPGTRDRRSAEIDRAAANTHVDVGRVRLDLPRNRGADREQFLALIKLDLLDRRYRSDADLVEEFHDFVITFLDRHLAWAQLSWLRGKVFALGVTNLHR